eukprot:12686806-Alexandrium_andersonii.AAC.1
MECTSPGTTPGAESGAVGAGAAGTAGGLHLELLAGTVVRTPAGHAPVPVASEASVGAANAVGPELQLQL